MVLGSSNFYARLNGKIYCFQDKKQRDNCGGIPISALEAYKEYDNVYDVLYMDYKRFGLQKVRKQFNIKEVSMREFKIAITTLIIFLVFIFIFLGFLFEQDNRSEQIEDPTVSEQLELPLVSELPLVTDQVSPTYLISNNYFYQEVTSLPTEYKYQFQIDGTTYYFTESQWYDIDHIARIVFAEAGNQSYDCRLAVASVIMNRVTCRYYNFGTDVVSVLSAPNQFHTWQCSNYLKEPSQENLEIAVKSYLGFTNIPYNVLFFRATTSHSDWGNYSYYTTIQDVSFYTYD